VGLEILRSRSSAWRAYTDLMVPPFDRWGDWQSGLGSGVDVLYGLVRAGRPGAVVEIGSARGKSTCAMALACRHNDFGKVYAIDPHTENGWSEGYGLNTFEFLSRRLAEYELAPWCQVMPMTSAEAAARWALPIDLLFIDGDHTFQGVKQDFELFKPWLTERSLVVFHDSLWEHEGGGRPERPEMGVPRYLESLRTEGFHSVTVRAPYGLTILYPIRGGFPFAPAPSSGEVPSSDSGTQVVLAG
jgi:predicted O-methyltransferase YrrM